MAIYYQNLRYNGTIPVIKTFWATPDAAVYAGIALEAELTQRLEKNALYVLEREQFINQCLVNVQDVMVQDILVNK